MARLIKSENIEFQDKLRIVEMALEQSVDFNSDDKLSDFLSKVSLYLKPRVDSDNSDE